MYFNRIHTQRRQYKLRWRRQAATLRCSSTHHTQSSRARLLASNLSTCFAFTDVRQACMLSQISNPTITLVVIKTTQHVKPAIHCQEAAACWEAVPVVLERHSHRGAWRSWCSIAACGQGGCGPAWSRCSGLGGAAAAAAELLTQQTPLHTLLPFYLLLLRLLVLVAGRSCSSCTLPNSLCCWCACTLPCLRHSC